MKDYPQQLFVHFHEGKMANQIIHGISGSGGQVHLSFISLLSSLSSLVKDFRTFYSRF